MRPGNVKRFHVPTQVISPVRPRGAEKWCDGWLVKVLMSYDYNGGIVIDGEWYQGYDVPKPIVPEGYELKSIACGYELNARPPYCSMLLRKTTAAAVTPQGGGTLGQARVSA